MRGCSVVLLLVLAVPSSLAAQTIDIEALRARARARGWQWERGTTPVGGGDERWCPASYAACAGPYERSDAEVFAVLWGMHSPSIVTMRERRGDWIVELSLDLSVHTFAMRMVRGADVVRIGWETSLPLPDGGTVVAPHADARPDHAGWLRAELDAYLASPASFRDRLALRDGELRAHVQRVIGVLTICPTPSDPRRIQHMPGPEGARGLVDTCARRPLDREERRALLARLETETGRRARLARAYAATWHAALMSMLARRPSRR